MQGLTLLDRTSGKLPAPETPAIQSDNRFAAASKPPTGQHGPEVADGLFTHVLAAASARASAAPQPMAHADAGALPDPGLVAAAAGGHLVTPASAAIADDGFDTDDDLPAESIAPPGQAVEPFHALNHDMLWEIAFGRDDPISGLRNELGDQIADESVTPEEVATGGQLRIGAIPIPTGDQTATVHAAGPTPAPPHPPVGGSHSTQTHRPESPEILKPGQQTPTDASRLAARPSDEAIAPALADDRPLAATATVTMPPAPAAGARLISAVPSAAPPERPASPALDPRTSPPSRTEGVRVHAMTPPNQVILDQSLRDGIQPDASVTLPLMARLTTAAPTEATAKTAEPASPQASPSAVSAPAALAIAVGAHQSSPTSGNAIAGPGDLAQPSALRSRSETSTPLPEQAAALPPQALEQQLPALRATSPWQAIDPVRQAMASAPGRAADPATPRQASPPPLTPADDSAPAQHLAAVSADEEKPGRLGRGENHADTAAPRPSPSASRTPTTPYATTPPSAAAAMAPPSIPAASTPAARPVAVRFAEALARSWKASEGQQGQGSPIGRAEAGSIHQEVRGQSVDGRPLSPQQQTPAELREIPVRIVRALNDGAARLTLTLRPQELGRLNMRLHFVDGQLTVDINADRPETLHLLQREADGLERGLRQAGLDLREGGLQFGAHSDSGRQRAGSELAWRGVARPGEPGSDGDHALPPPLQHPAATGQATARTIDGALDIRL